ncbi:hypothetical protein H4P1_00038 (plasmid) [Variovorax sp. PBS-H4]|nr:hypothetical protein H4P1_00038 [Variovorax sp. PBS-H4]
MPDRPQLANGDSQYRLNRPDCPGLGTSPARRSSERHVPISVVMPQRSVPVSGRHQIFLDLGNAELIRRRGETGRSSRQESDASRSAQTRAGVAVWLASGPAAARRCHPPSAFRSWMGRDLFDGVGADWPPWQGGLFFVVVRCCPGGAAMVARQPRPAAAPAGGGSGPGRWRAGQRSPVVESSHPRGSCLGRVAVGGHRRDLERSTGHAAELSNGPELCAYT